MKLGILLFNLGGPDSSEAIEPFLANLFSDPDIIPIPLGSLLRPFVGRLIARLRVRHAKANYDLIGGKSPILEITRRQGNALARALNEMTGGAIEPVVKIGMRYWHPFTTDAMDEFEREGIRDVFLLTLYPQYSVATTGSSFREWRNLHRRRGGKTFRVRSVKDYFTHPTYVASLSEAIDSGLSRFPADRRENVHLLFSAHGLPESIVRKGDPYVKQIHATVQATLAARRERRGHTVSFQSKVGPARWVGPATFDTIPALIAEGKKDLLVIPVAFVSDHVETLCELDIEAREVAERAGVRQFEVTPGLNDSPTFIRALAEVVRGRLRI